MRYLPGELPVSQKGSNVSTVNLTELQRRVLAVLSRTREWTNAQVAERADCSDPGASRILRKLARAGLATSRVVQDANEPNIRYRMWRRA